MTDTTPTVQKFAGQLRKGSVLTGESVRELGAPESVTTLTVAKIESAMGGSWFNVWFVGHADAPPTSYGRSEKIEVKS